MAAAKARRKRSRGSVEELRSGALRVAVYAGLDPLTGRRHYLREVIPPGPTAAAEAERRCAASPARSTSADFLERRRADDHFTTT